MLGQMYYLGQGVAQDYKQSFSWYKKSAEQEDAVAQCMLGQMYYLGQGVAQDEKEGIKWLQKAADQGEQDAINILKELNVAK